MSVRRFLDVSSGHLSAATWVFLDVQTSDLMVRDPGNGSAEILGGRTRHGWFVYAIEAPIAPVPADLAPSCAVRDSMIASTSCSTWMLRCRRICRSCIPASRARPARPDHCGCP